MVSVKRFFSDDQVKHIEQAIKAAEKNTSGEIRVHIEETCNGEVLDSAKQIFSKLEMHKTKLRNGILFYIAVKDQKFAVFGDEGINKQVPPDFWNSICETVLTQFKTQKFTEGISEGIHMAGHALKQYFPYSNADTNELSNEVTFGNKQAN